MVLDSPAGTESLTRVGYDDVCLDQQHGLLRCDGLMVVDTGPRLGPVETVGIVQTAADAVAGGG